MKNYVIYARKAASGQKYSGNAISTQIEALHRYADEEGFNVVSIFADFGSGLSNSRPAFAAMMSSINNRSVGGIICWGIDRLTRDCKTFLKVKKILKKYAVKLIIPRYQRDNAIDQELSEVLSLYMSQYERKALSERIKRGLRNKRRKSLLTNKE